MKKILSILIVMAFLTASADLEGQCDPETFSSACVQKLATGFNFLKSYKIDGEGGSKEKVEYSYVFTKGTQYMINICSGGETTDGIVVSLFDATRNKVATSKIDGQVASAIAYPCNATGIYYIQYTFDRSAAHCGGSSLGFKR